MKFQEVSHNGWHQMFHMCHYPFAILFAPWNTCLILNINYLVSFACSACWPFISTGNEEPALDKSIACTTQASQASRVTSVYIVLQMCPAGVPCRCFGNLFQKDDGWKSNKHCPKRTPKRTLWYLWWESIQQAFNCHFMPTSFCQSVLGSFFRHAAESLPLHCCLLLLVKSQVSTCFYNPFCSQSLLIKKTKKINSCSVQHIHIWGQKQS